MAQHDYNIANQSGQAFRADLNNALSAIVSSNSGASAPSTTYAYQWWVDTSTTPATLKQRNSSNNAWLTIGQLDTANLGLIPAGGASIVNADVNANAGIASSKLSFTNATGATARTIQSRLRETFSVKDFGAVGDGVADDTAAIQAALDAAAGMYNQVAFPPAGAAYNPPIVLFPPGAYRLTDTLNVYNGLTLSGMAGVPYTVEHTRLIMDTQGGTVNLTKNILNLTRVFQGTVRSNIFVTTIEDLGFWITNPGSTIPGRGGTGWSYDGAKGSHIYCAEPCVDTRIRRCNFYSSPNSAIYFNGSSVAFFNVDQCEFDTPQVGIRMNNCASIWPQVNQSRFFGGFCQIYTTNCGGQIQVNGCDFQSNGRVSISGTTQLSKLTFTSNLHDGAGVSDNSLFASNVKCVVVSDNYFGVSTESAILLENVDDGVISGNTIDSPGYNTSNSTAALAPAGIRLIGCKQLSVTGNSIRTETGGTYNGFGIISSSSGGRTSRSLFSGNYIAAAFNGASHRGQSRHLNVETTDSLAGNQFEASAVEYRLLRTRAGIHYAFPLTYQATSGNAFIALDDTASCRAYVHVEQLSSNSSLEFEVIISRTNFGGTYSIKSVNRDGTAGVGNGPHVVSTGNTVAFSISGSSLQIAFSYTSDAMLYSAVVIGAARV
jgi:hypothetical protein